jgi:hypothetical protein
MSLPELDGTLLSSFLNGFRVSFLNAPILLTGSKSANELPSFKMPPNEKFLFVDYDFLYLPKRLLYP